MIRRICLSGLVVALAVSVVTPAVADTYLVYSEKGIGQSPCDGTCYFQYCLEGEAFCQAQEPGCLWGCGIPGECDVPEGDSYQKHSALYSAPDEGYVGWAALPKACAACPVIPMDMRDFAGDMRLFVRLVPAVGNHRVKVEFECDPDPATYPSGVSYVTYVADHGWQTNTDWQEVVIPLVDSSFPIALDLSQPTTGDDFGFEVISPHRPLDDVCLANVQVWSKITLEKVDSGTVFAEMSIDFIRWQKENTHTGASDVTTDGRQLKVDGKPFVVNGVAYNPVGIGENWQFTWVDRGDRYDVDYPLMTDLLGVNAVRVYAPLVTTRMLDKAWEEGMFVIPTFEIESTNLECPQGKSFLQDRFADMVAQWKDHPAILFWLVGNEVNQNLGAANLCTDWYPQLNAMALAAENAGSTHPVGTAVAGVGDLCTACSDDIDLPNVDLWGVNLYPGNDFGTAFTAYDADPNCERPLIVTEVGIDAFDRPSNQPGSEDQARQATDLGLLFEDGHADLTVRPGGLGVLSGQVLYEWADEWWKAECSMTGTWSSHETCSDWDAPFFDGKAHEEWFGVVALDSGDPSLRTDRTAAATLGEKWLGPVCSMRVEAFDAGTGNTTISFAQPAGAAADTNLYYGPLSAVSSHAYSGSLPALGTAGTADVTLPAGDLFWVVAAENLIGEEGCYGMDSAGTERPCFSGNCAADQVSGWNCWCRP